jgi:hypothetical protein
MSEKSFAKTFLAVSLSSILHLVRDERKAQSAPSPILLSWPLVYFLYRKPAKLMGEGESWTRAEGQGGGWLSCISHPEVVSNSLSLYAEFI